MKLSESDQKVYDQFKAWCADKGFHYSVSYNFDGIYIVDIDSEDFDGKNLEEVIERAKYKVITQKRGNYGLYDQDHAIDFKESISILKRNRARLQAVLEYHPVEFTHFDFSTVFKKPEDVDNTIADLEKYYPNAKEDVAKAWEECRSENGDYEFQEFQTGCIQKVDEDMHPVCEARKYLD